MRQVQRVLAQRLQLVLAAGDEARAHRRRGAEQVQQQARMAAEVADQREVLARSSRPAATSCSGCPRSSACAGRSGAPGPCGRRSWRGRRWTAVAADRDGLVGRAGRRACSRPTAARRRSRGRRTGGSAVSSSRQASTPACTPVMSSSCDSLKSVVMCGCVSAEPSAAGCGVSASAAVGRARRLSFSMPRRMPCSVDGGIAPRRAFKLLIGWTGETGWRAKVTQRRKTCRVPRGTRVPRAPAPPPVRLCRPP